MILQDFRQAIRVLRKDAVVSLTAIAILALGIGGTSIVFSLANGLLIRPLPYPQSDRIISVQESKSRAASDGMGVVAFPNYLDMQTRTRLLGSIGLFNERLATIRGEGDAERVPAANVTYDIFRVLGVRPILGRTFNREEDLPKGPKSVVIGEDLWRIRYGASSEIIGRIINISGAQTQIIGVMPSSFRFPQTAVAWLPLQMDPAIAVRTDHFLSGIARLKPGVSIQAADAELKSMMEQINRENPVTSYGATARAFPVRDVLAGSYAAQVIMLLVAAGVLLLIACANLTNLMLVKATGRSREMAVRRAIGASRGRLIRQLITESVCLGSAGGVAGLALTYLGLPALLHLIPVDLPAWMYFGVDVRVLAFVIAASLLTSILFGIAPAFGASRVDPASTLHDFARGATQSRGRRILRNSLVVCEVALSLILLIGAGLLMRSFSALRGQSLGFDTPRIVTLYLATPDRYPAGPKSAALLDRIRESFSALSGVTSVAFASGIPFESTWGRSLTVEGFPVLALKDAPMINHTVVTPGYFHTLGIPVIAGRDFDRTDYENPLTTIVDETLAKLYWPNESAVGHRIRFGPPEDNEPWHVIVGVVRPVLNQRLIGSPRWDTYIPFNKHDAAGMSVVVRTSGNPAQLISAVRARMHDIDRDIALSAVYTLDQVVDRIAWQERFFAILFGVFAAVATALVIVGLYGVLAYAVTLRTGEIGIRMALGASTGKVLAMVLRQGLVLVAVGLAIGFAAAFAVTRVLASQLYHVSATDPVTYLGVAAIFTAVALAACWIPAYRATRVDPVRCLRSE
jgi:putative ABC transport system permease protein